MLDLVDVKLVGNICRSLLVTSTVRTRDAWDGPRKHVASFLTISASAPSCCSHVATLASWARGRDSGPTSSVERHRGIEAGGALLCYLQ